MAIQHADLLGNQSWQKPVFLYVGRDFLAFHVVEATAAHLESLDALPLRIRKTSSTQGEHRVRFQD